MTTVIRFKISFLFFFIPFIVFTSCSGSKRAAIKKELNAAKNMSKNDSKKIADINTIKTVKFNEEKIDSSINSNINQKLSYYKFKLDSLSTSISFLDSVIKTGHLYNKNKSEIIHQLKIIRSYKNDSIVRLRRFEMIDEGLSIAEQHLFNLAAFFGPGKYEIPSDKKSAAEQKFTPILDSLTSFYNKYKDVDRYGTVRILGFADGTGFNKESETFKTLTGLLNDSTASKEVINGKLSELRAKNIANLMEEILSKKIYNFNAIKNLDFIFLETGKGENLPSKKITDYTENDERRRVVLLFWSILPK